MQATNSTTTTKLPSIKFLLESSVEMFNNGDQQVPVEPRNPSNPYNGPSRKLPTLSLNIPSPKGLYLTSPVEDNTTGYQYKGNQYQNNLPRLPSIGSVVNNNNNNNRDIVQKPNSIQSLLSPPESPDMTPSFNDYMTANHHHQRQQLRPGSEYHYSKTTSPVYSSNVAPMLTPHHHQSHTAQSYVQPEQRGYDRVGGYHQERVAYNRAYPEQNRMYPSSNASPTTLQPAFSPFDSRPTTASTTLPRLDPMLSNGRRLSTPISTKIIDPLTTPISGIVPSTSVNNNRYQCPYCSKRFSRPSSLRIHTYSHTGEKPFVCTEPGCGRKFSVQSNMRRHLRVHRLGRPVKKVRYDGEVEGVKMLNHGAIMRNC